MDQFDRAVAGPMCWTVDAGSGPVGMAALLNRVEPAGLIDQALLGRRERLGSGIASVDETPHPDRVDITIGERRGGMRHVAESPGGTHPPRRGPMRITRPMCHIRRSRQIPIRLETPPPLDLGQQNGAPRLTATNLPTLLLIGVEQVVVRQRSDISRIG